MPKNKQKDLNINDSENRSDEMYTPLYILDWARLAMKIDQFDCDPATPLDNPTGAKVYYTLENSGLAEKNDWIGNVFMNPPFSNQLPFVQKLLSQLKKGNVKQCVFLTKSDFRPKWAKLLLNHADMMVAHKGGVKFIPNKHTARFGVALYCFGVSYKQVQEACKSNSDHFKAMILV